MQKKYEESSRRTPYNIKKKTKKIKEKIISDITKKATEELTTKENIITEKGDEQVKLKNENNDLMSALDPFHKTKRKLMEQKKKVKESVAFRVFLGVSLTLLTVVTGGIGLLVVAAVLMDRKEEQKKEKKYVEGVKSGFITEAAKSMINKGIELPDNINFDNFEKKLSERISSNNDAIASSQKIIEMKNQK